MSTEPTTAVEPEKAEEFTAIVITTTGRALHIHLVHSKDMAHIWCQEALEKGFDVPNPNGSHSWIPARSIFGIDLFPGKIEQPKDPLSVLLGAGYADKIR